MTSGGWRVVLWNDDINSVTTVAFVLHRLIGMSIGKALDLPHEVHERGVMEIAVLDDREQAEMMVARMQVFGLHGGVIPA
jgi:ATP-dependent Clp protease adapter protein ClpS